MPTTSSGFDDAAAMSAMGIDEVFEAKITSSAVASSTCLTIDCLRSRSSNTASMTRSVVVNPSHVDDPVTRFITRSTSNGVMRRRFARLDSTLLT